MEEGGREEKGAEVHEWWEVKKKEERKAWP